MAMMWRDRYPLSWRAWVPGSKRGNLRTFWGAILIALCLACTPVSEAPTESEASQPNLFLISIDTLRSDHLSPYGYAKPTSPFLARLAAEGRLYRQAVVNTHGTTPSHATILSSLPQEIHRVGYTGSAEDRVPEAIPLVQTVLGEAGYWTLGVTGGGNAGGKFGFDRDFDRFDDKSRAVVTGIDRFFALLDQRPAEQPVFGFFHTYEVHSPYTPPAEYRSTFGPGEGSVEPTSEKLVEWAHRAHELAEEDLRHIVAQYDGGIAHTDGSMERFFAGLEERGLLKSSLLIITSDHGEEFGEHGGLLHRGLLYDELLRVPMILWGSCLAGESGERDDLVSSLDIAPTLLACAGLQPPKSWQGRDLLTTAETTNPPGTEPIISQYGRTLYSVRTATWKLIVSEGEARELYHLEDDPHETTNLAAKEPGTVENLLLYLRKWRQQQAAAGAAQPGNVELSDEDKRHLEALGYL